MKKRFFCFIFFVVFSLLLVACDENGSNEDQTLENAAAYFKENVVVQIEDEFVLPVLPEPLNEVTVTWLAESDDVINANGTTNRQNEDVEITVYLTFSYGGKTHHESIVVVVKAIDPQIHLDFVKDELVLQVEVRENIELSTSVQAVEITWVSSNEEIISNTGIVHRTLEEQEVVLTATLSYRGLTAEKTFEIKIMPLIIESVDLIEPNRKIYFLEEVLNLEGASIRTKYDDDSFSDVGVTLEMVSGYDNETAGIQTITVTYMSETYTFDVEVKDPDDLVVLDTPTNIGFDETEVLVWDNVAHHLGYLIRIKDSNLSFNVSTNRFDLLNQDIESGSYQLEIRALGDVYNYTDSEWSDSFTFEQLSGPRIDRPFGLVANQHGVAWGAQPDATGFRIYIDDSQGNEIEGSPFDGPAVYYAFNLLELDLADDTYQIKIQALGNGQDLFDSLLSNAISFVIETPLIPLDEPGLVILDDVLSWELIENAVSYVFYIDDEIEIEEATSPIDLSVFNLEPGSYTLKLIAIGDDGYIDSESEINYLIESAEAVELSPPDNVEIDEGVLTWDLVENATKYHVVIGDMTHETEMNSFDLGALNLPTDTYSVFVIAIGDSVNYKSSSASETVEYESVQVITQLNPISRGDIAGTPEEGHGGGHYDIVIHRGHGVFQQEGWSGLLRVEVELNDGSVIYEEYDMSIINHIFMNKPTPEPWFFDQIPENGIYQMSIILVGDASLGFSNSEALVLSLNWQYTS